MGKPVKPVFYYGYRLSIGVYSLLFGMILLVFASYLATGALVGSLVFGLLDGLLLITILNFYFRPIHQAWFFEDHFKISGRNSAKDFTYSEVERVEKLRVLPVVSPYAQVKIAIKGGLELAIPANPTNKTKGIDLYTWLREATYPHAEEPSS